MPQVQPIVMILTILVGIFIFSEKVSQIELFGLSLIVSGVYIINRFKITK